jgi:RING-variant domain
MSKSEAPQMPLIRPCLCSGHMSFVHIACLNTWRTMSAAAHQKCPVCQYQYQTRKTIAAEFLMSDRGASVLTAAIIFLSIVLVGALVVWIPLHFGLPRVDVILRKYIYSKFYSDYHYYYQHSNRGYSDVWFDCPPSHQRVLSRSTGLWDTVKRLFQLLVSKRSHVYNDDNNHSGIGNPYIYSNGYMDNSHYLVEVLCIPVISKMANILITGAITVGGFGFAHHVYLEVLAALQDGMGRLLSLCFQFLALSNEAAYRLGVAVGLAMSAKAICTVTLVQSKRLGQWLGEFILEPVSSSSSSML